MPNTPSQKQTWFYSEIARGFKLSEKPISTTKIQANTLRDALEAAALIRDFLPEIEIHSVEVKS
jgi:hypothetical protein